jgi:hypothetical protein
MTNNIFQDITSLRWLMANMADNHLFTHQEQNIAKILGAILDNGKMFEVDLRSDFQPIYLPIPYQNLPFPIMYIVYNDIIYFCTQESEHHNIFVFMAIREDDKFEPLNVRGEFYSRDGDMFYRASCNHDIDSKIKVTSADNEFIEILLSDARYLIAAINNPSDVKIEEHKTPSRKCKPGESKFKLRYSIVAIPQKKSRSGVASKTSKTGKTIALHDRRGHYRKLPNKTVWVRACKVGSIKNGITIQQYKVGATNDK